MIRSCRGLARSCHVAIGPQLLYPTRRIEECFELVARDRRLPSGPCRMNHGMSFGGGVLRSEIRVEINRNLVCGEVAVSLSNMSRGGKDHLAFIASNLKTAPGHIHRYAIRSIGWRKVHLHIVFQQDDRFLSAVCNTQGMSLALWKTESDRIRSGSVAGFTVEGQIASGDVNHSVAATWRWICAGEVDLHVTLASHRACRRLVTALTRMDIVVAVSLAPINGHPYVFQQISVLILVLGGVRSADRKYRAVTFHF